MKSISILLLTLFTCLSYGQGDDLYKFRNDKGRHGFIDQSGKIKIQSEFYKAGDFNEGLCKASKEIVDGKLKWTFIDTTGAEVIRLDFNTPETIFSEGFARVSNKESHWFIDTKGINVIGKTWKDGIGHFENGIAFVSDSIKKDYYKIDLKGNKIDELTFSKEEVEAARKEEQTTENFKNRFKSDTYKAFKEDNFWGFKNEQDSIVIAPQYYLVDTFEKGICAVKIKKEKFSSKNDYFLDAIINEDGEVLIKTDMHTYQGFQGALIKYYGRAHYGGGIYYLDEKGQRVIPFE